MNIFDNANAAARQSIDIERFRLCARLSASAEMLADDGQYQTAIDVLREADDHASKLTGTDARTIAHARLALTRSRIEDAR